MRRFYFFLSPSLHFLAAMCRPDMVRALEQEILHKNCIPDLLKLRKLRRKGEQERKGFMNQLALANLLFPPSSSLSLCSYIKNKRKKVESAFPGSIQMICVRRRRRPPFASWPDRPGLAIANERRKEQKKELASLIFLVWLLFMPGLFDSLDARQS